MELVQTIEMMQSENYKERFGAEYCQLKIRYDKLNAMINKYEAGRLDFEPSCSIALLKKERKAMLELLHILEVRAEVEQIDLQDVIRAVENT